MTDPVWHRLPVHPWIKSMIVKPGGFHVYPAAGFVAELIEIVPGGYRYKAYPFDCDGKSVPIPGAFRWLSVVEALKSPLYDLRNIGQVLAGCCPPQLMTEFLRQEGMPD